MNSSWKILPALFLVFSPQLSALPAQFLPALSTSSEISKAGIAAAVRGNVQIESRGQAGRILKNGEAVYIEDRISTDEKSNLQILLLDETIFTIGPNSSIVIDQFIYNPAQQTGQIEAKIVKGTFRFVTGKIARKKPSNMKVELPSGSIGIRGTIAAGRVLESGRSTVVLLGPGSRTNTRHRIGQVTVANEVNGELKEVTVTRPGYGTVIEGSGSAPSQVFEIPAEELGEMMGDLGPSVDDSTGNDDDSQEGGGVESDPEADSGQDTAGAGESIDMETVLNDIFDDAVEEAARASQDDFEDDLLGEDGEITSVEDLNLVTSGKFHYSDSSVPLDGGNGDATYVLELDIDFGNRTIGGSVASQNSIVVTIPTLSTPKSATYPLDEKSFNDAEGDLAVFDYKSVANTNSSGCSTCGNADIDISLINREGVIAGTALHSIEFQDSSGPADYEGGRETGPRSPA